MAAGELSDHLVVQRIRVGGKYLGVIARRLPICGKTPGKGSVFRGRHSKAGIAPVADLTGCRIAMDGRNAA
jgi:hypothetical protein